MKAATIKSSWIGLHPTRRMDAPYWLSVSNHLNDNNLEPTEDNVRAAIKAVDSGATLQMLEAKRLRRQADALNQRAREIEDGVNFYDRQQIRRQ